MAVAVMAGPLQLGNGAAAAQTSPSSPASAPSSFPPVDPKASTGKAPPEVEVPIPDVAAVGKPPMPSAAKAGEELLERRTAASKTFVGDEPGQLRTTVFQAPVHFKDPQGRWVDIDDALGAPKDGRRRNGANAFGLSIAEKSTDKALARLDIDDKHSVGFALDGAAEVKAKGDAKSVTYAKVKTDTDVRLTSLRSGVKEELVLASPAAPDRFVFPLELKGLTASLDGAGNVIYRDGAGVERARTPHGFMTDGRIDPRSGESEMSLGVTYALIPWKGGTALEVRLDRAWLNDPARQYPVTVDPDIHHAAWGDDTYVMSGFYRDNSYDAELKVGTYDGGAHIGRSFMHFDTGAFAGATVQNAEMHLAERHSWNCGYWPEHAYRVTGGWNGRNMPDWSNQPPVDPNGVGGTWEGTICGSRTAKWNVTGMAAAWAAAGQPEASVSLRATNESDNNRWKKYASTEAGAPPALHVWFTPPNRPPAVPYNVTPANNHVYSTPYTSVSATYSDPDGTPGVMAIGVWAHATNQLMWSTWTGTLCSGCSASYNVPALATDKWYYVMAIGHDGVQYSSAWSSPQYFFIDTLPPAASELTPVNGASGNSPTQVSARYSEPYGFTGYMYFWLYTTGGTKIVENWSAITNPGAVATLAIPNLAPGTYNLWAMPWDTRQTGPQIGPNTFTVGSPPTTTTVPPTTTTVPPTTTTVPPTTTTVPPTTTTVPPTTTTVPPPTTTTTTVPAPRVPSAPTGVVTSDPLVRNGVGELTVSWIPPEDLRGSELIGYTILTDRDCTCTGIHVTDVSATSSRVTGLTLGVPYVFSMRASSSNGPGDTSEATAPMTVDPPVVRVMTWNLKRGLDKDGQFLLADIGDWADEIRRNRVDVVGFQEITRRQADDLASELGWPEPHYIQTDVPSPCPTEEIPFPPRCVAYGNAIVSKYALPNRDYWDLPKSREEDLGERKLLRGSFTIEGVQFHVYTAHLAAHPGATPDGDTDRSAQTQDIVRRTAEDRQAAESGGGGLPYRGVVLCDCNARPDDNASGIMRGHFVDAWEEMHGRAGGLTSNPRASTGLTQRIDYVYVSRANPWSVNESYVNVPPSAPLSDHLAVVAEL
jgi:endonuclease/exonuclease/phosphatase family metal-dependent hydrolase